MIHITYKDGNYHIHQDQEYIGAAKVGNHEEIDKLINSAIKTKGEDHERRII
jgi:hypothetical protein